MRTILFGLAIAVLAGAVAFSQVSTIRVDSNLVLTPVWVADSSGHAVRDLKLEDFEIEENGIRIAPARLGEPGEAPVELAMLFDMSGSVFARFELERQAAARFLNRILRPNDAVAIISIANEPKVLQARTSSLSEALRAVSMVQPTTQATAFFNSVSKAASMLQEVDRPDARHVIVALSDGEDNRSIGNRQADVLRELQLTNCLFYSINPRGASYRFNIFGRRAQESMEALAQETGGASFVADTVEELSAFYDRIADELQGQYLLGYYSPAKTGKAVYRKIAIIIRGRQGIQVKARPGYYPN